jgi:hypothetical protein
MSQQEMFERIGRKLNTIRYIVDFWGNNMGDDGELLVKEIEQELVEIRVLLESLRTFKGEIDVLSI